MLCSNNLLIRYCDDNGDSQEIRLHHLRERGFSTRNALKRFIYYRKKHLVAVLHAEYGQDKMNSFLRNPTEAKFMTEVKFLNLLQEIDESIATNYSKYEHLFEPYSGPQCFADRATNRLEYDVNYKEQKKRIQAYMENHPRTILLNSKKPLLTRGFPYGTVMVAARSESLAREQQRNIPSVGTTSKTKIKNLNGTDFIGPLVNEIDLST